MKNYLLTGAIIGCLLIGSFYPRMILNHHLILVDESGTEIGEEDICSKKIPVEFQFRFLQMFR